MTCRSVTIPHGSICRRSSRDNLSTGYLLAGCRPIATCAPSKNARRWNLPISVLAPSSFVAETVRAFYPNKALALAPYGVDLDFWTAGARNEGAEVLRFIYAGQISLRKGIPSLLQAWEKAALRSAELLLVGSWYLSDSKRASLPRYVTHVSALSSEALRDHYRRSDVFVFPSFFEGLALVLLEAMACGLASNRFHRHGWRRCADRSVRTVAARWRSGRPGRRVAVVRPEPQPPTRDGTCGKEKGGGVYLGSLSSRCHRSDICVCVISFVLRRFRCNDSTQRLSTSSSENSRAAGMTQRRSC